MLYKRNIRVCVNDYRNQQFPWVVAQQNNLTAAVNNLRRIGARRSGQMSETRRIELRLAELLSNFGFAVEVGYQPDRIEQQAIRNLAIAENIRLLYEQMKQTFADVLSSRWSVNALDFVFTNPVFRNNKFTTNSGISAATAARFTRELLENNLIVTIEEASGRRPALYSFEPLMQLVRV